MAGASMSRDGTVLIAAGSMGVSVGETIGTQRRMRSGALVLSAALALAMTAVAFRTAAVRLEPRAAVLFELLGLPVNLAKLEIGRVSARIAAENDRRVLLVEGEVLNQTAEIRTVPPMRVEVRSGDGRAIYAWATNSARQRIEPGERAAFSARLASPPAEGVEVVVEFESAEDKALPAQSQARKRTR